MIKDVDSTTGAFVNPIEWKWFNAGQDCLGVVLAIDKLGVYHGYLGVGRGWSEKKDVTYIISHGCRLTKEATCSMLDSDEVRIILDSISEEKWKM